MDSLGPAASRDTRMPQLFDALDESGPSRTNIPPPPSSRGSSVDRPFSHHFSHHSYYSSSKPNQKRREHAAKNGDRNLEDSSSDHDSDRDDDLSNVFGDF